MDLKHKLKELVMSEFAYDLSKYEDEGEAKVNNVTENLVKLFSLYIVSQQRELLEAFVKQIKEDNELTEEITFQDINKCIASNYG